MIGIFVSIICALVILCAIAAFVLGLLKSEPFALVGAVVAFVLSIALLGFMCTTTVPTKQYGVVTTFNKPTGMLKTGLHFVWPWQDVHDYDAAIQMDTREDGNSKAPCTTVRITHQATACVNTSIKWRIKENSVDSLYQNYKSFDNVRHTLVDRELTSALNETFNKYDALAVNEKGDSNVPALSTLSAEVTKSMQKRVGNQIEVLNVLIPSIKLDNNIQNKVNSLLSQVAQTRIAEQTIKTNEKQSEANKKLSQSLNNDPNVLVSKCLDIVETSKSLPAGFTCWPGNASSVVVPSSK